MSHWFTPSSKSAEEIGDNRSLAYLLLFLGMAAIERGEYAAARSSLEKSLALFREMNNNGFCQKPRVGLWKRPQPLRCNPVVVEHIGAQGDDGGRIGPTPAHPSLFHATIDDQGHGPLDQAAAHGIALVFPVLIRANPGALVFQVPDRLSQRFERLSRQAGGQSLQPLHGLLDLAQPQRSALIGQLKVSFVLRERFGPRRGQDGGTDFAPQMRPIQNAGSLGEVLALLLLDPLRSIGKHDHRTRRITLQRTGGFGLHPKLPGRAKGGHIAPLRQPMALPGLPPGTSSLAPGEGRVEDRQRQVLQLRTDHRHFALHPATLFPTAHPAAIESHQQRLFALRQALRWRSSLSAGSFRPLLANSQITILLS